jgi:hypothetical protein
MAQKWEYSSIVGEIRKVEKGLTGSIYSDPRMVWTNKDKDGETTWDTIKAFGIKGWELISVTPIINDNATSSYTKSLLYTFKRPMEEQMESPK